jgi:hypothetical protein
MRTGFRFTFLAALLDGCQASAPPRPGRAADRPPAAATPTRAAPETVTVRDAELERRLGRMELRLLEKEAQVAELQARLEDVREDVIRTMARLETMNSRAEAASGMAEADVALQTLRGTAGGAQSPEFAQASQLVQRSNAEFGKRNFGGALYLANQARTLALGGRARLSSARGTLRPGEVSFAVPVRLKLSSRGNVREGPGTTFPVLFSLENGATVMGLSYADEWVRVADDSGRSGWIFRTLITRP